MFNRILVPLDGSVPATVALRVGEQLADRWRADLHVLTLVRKGEIETGVNSIIERQVAQVSQRPEVTVRPLSYSVADDIASEFDAVDDTLVVMSTWARGRTAGMIGNVAEDVLRLLRQPIVVIGPQADVGINWPKGPMFIATDDSHFGATIVPVAARMAEQLAVDTSLITVIDSSAVPAGIDRAAETNVLAGLAGTVESITGREVDYDVLHGDDPAKEIVDHARRYGGSMIALSTHGRSGMARIAVGSVAMDVVHNAHCPVLLSRPPVDPH